jgi:hypothetical protein
MPYAKFIGYVTRYAGGYGNPDGGIGALIPDDFEFRFTEKGSKMFDWWGTELLSDSPLEIGILVILQIRLMISRCLQFFLMPMAMAFGICNK